MKRVLDRENAGVVADEDHGKWYQQLFAPSVQAGILREADLAGYRSGQVHIRRSMHVPLKHEAVLDSMQTLFELLRDEEHPAVRVVLGHFIFVHIHPYLDGNGRIGRFLMNVMLASGVTLTAVGVQGHDAQRPHRPADGHCRRGSWSPNARIDRSSIH